MSAGHAAPLTLSDIPCELCGMYFTLDGDLIAHRASEHWQDPEPWVVAGDGWEQRLSNPDDNESRWMPTLMPRTRAEYLAEHERGSSVPKRPDGGATP